MKKPYRIVFAVLTAAVLGLGLYLRFGLRWEGVSLNAAALCIVALALSLDYKGTKFRAPVRALQAVAALLMAASVAGWFLAVPHGYDLALNLAAIGVNVPLAVIGIRKKED